MNPIESTSQTTSATSPQSQNANAVLGKQDFLTLLVAQLQNQDPLNPDNPTEFTAQLAQFSSLEQLFNLNGSMNNMAQSMANADQLAMLDAIGKEVVVQQNHFNYTGDPMTLGYQLDATASTVEVAIQRDGKTIAILRGEELEQGTHYITWDGHTEDGSIASAGDYTLKVSAKTANQNTIVARPLIRTLVTGVNLDKNSQQGRLVTQSGEIAFTDTLGVFKK